MFNILLYALLASCTAGLAASGAVYFLLRASVPDYDEDFVIEGISGPVDILRDSSAIPHISASSATDVYFAIGFVHAQDRLGQLLRARRATKNLNPREQNGEADPLTSDALEAYSAGVNAWVGLVAEGGRGRGSPEMLITDERMIAAWRPIDSLRIAQSLLYNLHSKGGPQGTSAPSDFLIPSNRPKTPELLSISPEVSLNAWALGGSRTVSGSPILAADISGPLPLPSEWYLADLQLPTGATIGATLPGLPFVVVGRNERVAWAFRSNLSNPIIEPESSSVGRADDLLTLLYLLARSTDANDAIGASTAFAPAGFEVLAIDRQNLARWPDRRAERPETFRDARLASLVNRQPIFSVPSAIAVQRDTVSAAARDLLPLMARELWFVSSASSIDTTRAERLRDEVLDDLAQWNGEMDRYSPEPLVFWAWIAALQRRILQDEFPVTKEVWGRPNPAFLYAVLSDRGDSAIWCDIRPTARTETCQEQVQAALDEALGRLVDRYGPDPSAWSWGKEHALIMEWAPIKWEGLVAGLLSLEAPISGDPFTQFSTSFASQTDRPLTSRAGSNFLAVMSFSEENDSFFIVPAGQSGHPLSRFYENMFSRWVQGDYLLMTTDLSLARGGAVGISRLSPAFADSSTKSDARKQ